MKTSELIVLLQKSLESNGDLQVRKEYDSMTTEIDENDLVVEYCEREHPHWITSSCDGVKILMIN